MIECLKKLQKANNVTPNPKVNEMEGELGSGPAEQSKCLGSLKIS